MRVIICRVFSVRGLNYRGILPRGFKSVIKIDMVIYVVSTSKCLFNSSV